MKHSEVKKQTIAMVKTILVDEETQQAYKERIKSRFAYGYTDHPENVFTYEGDVLKSPIVRMATMSPEDLSHLGESVSIERNEKFNRFIHTIQNFSFDVSPHIPQLEVVSEEEVQVTFRAGGDYVVKFPCGKESYGSKLSAADFHAEGFNVRMFDGKLMRYVKG